MENDNDYIIDNNNNQTHSKKCQPEEDSNLKINVLRKLGDKLVYSYVRSILKRGSQLHAVRINHHRRKDGDGLAQKDLFNIPKIMDDVLLQINVKKIYESKKKDVLRFSSRTALVGVLWSFCSSLYIPVGFWQLVNVII